MANYSILVLSLAALAIPAEAQILIPQTISPPAVVKETPDVGSMLKDNAEFWAGLANAKEQMTKMESARQAIAEKLPKGSTESYDIVVQGNQFVGFVKKGENILAPGVSVPTRLVQTDIVGVAPTQAEKDAHAKLEQAARDAKSVADQLKAVKAKQEADAKKARSAKEQRDSAMDRDTHRIRDQINEFKKAGGNYRAPAM